MAPEVGDGPGFSTGPDEAYSRFQEGSRLLDSGNSHAAVVALERARDLEPDKGSIREALARAYFRSQRVEAARVEFEKVLELDPVNDYAHFGLGMCLLRKGDRAGARGHLKIATIMRPDDEAYQEALRQASQGQAADDAAGQGSQARADEG